MTLRIGLSSDFNTEVEVPFCGGYPANRNRGSVVLSQSEDPALVGVKRYIVIIKGE